MYLAVKTSVKMGKSKSAKPDMAIKASKDSQVKTLSSVKDGAVTKPSQTLKSKSKDLAKQVAAKADKVDKKSKKVKEPTPESMSESEEDDEEESEESASSQSSGDDSEADVPAPKKEAGSNGTKLNGAAKADSDSEEDSESSESSDDEATAAKPGLVATAKAVAGAKAGSGSDEDSEEDSDEESDEEKVEVPGAVDAKKLNGKLEKVASQEVCAHAPFYQL